MTRKRNPRRVLIEMLKTPRQRLTWIYDTFTSPGNVSREIYDWTERDERGAALFRLRRPDEYPENDSDAWANVYAQASNAAMELLDIRDFALQQQRASAIRRDVRNGAK